jgi:uncharacterized protein
MPVVRAFLASPLGFLIGLSLGALGGGGSILAVPVLVYAAGQGPKSATTTSLLLVGIASAVGMMGHLRAGRVAVGTGLAFGLTGIGGSLVGSAINRRSNPNVLLLAFAGLVLVAAWRMLTGCPTCTRVGELNAMATAEGGAGTRRFNAMTVATVLAAGTAVGFLTGLFGVGGGFVIVPALTLGLKLPMPKAVGTSLLVIVVNTTVALMTAAIGGVLTGTRIADRLDPKRSLRAFSALLVAVALYTALRAGYALSH